MSSGRELVPRGRPADLTPEKIKALVQVVAAGNYLSTACRTLGIPYSTYQNWRQKGDRARATGALAQDSLYVRLVEEISRAEAEAEERAINAWTAAFDSDWRAAMEYAARKAPQRWGRPEARDPLRGLPSEIKELHLHLEGPQDAFFFRDPDDDAASLASGADDDVEEGIFTEVEVEE